MLWRHSGEWTRCSTFLDSDARIIATVGYYNPDRISTYPTNVVLSLLFEYSGSCLETTHRTVEWYCRAPWDETLLRNVPVETGAS